MEEFLWFKDEQTFSSCLLKAIAPDLYLMYRQCKEIGRVCYCHMRKVYTEWMYSLGSLCAGNECCKRKLQSIWGKGLRPLDLVRKSLELTGLPGCIYRVIHTSIIDLGMQKVFVGKPPNWRKRRRNVSKLWYIFSEIFLHIYTNTEFNLLSTCGQTEAQTMFKTSQQLNNLCI